MKLFLAALTILSLSFLAFTHSAESVTLTNERPNGSFLLQQDVLKRAPAVLEVTLTKVDNPAKKPVNIFVYLAGSNAKGVVTEKLGIGNFSLYPVDRPGKFMLDPAPAFRKISETKNVKVWRLAFELGREADPVEVTIAPPNWKSN